MKNQCPPLLESYRHDVSPPLLQPAEPWDASPSSVSSEIGADRRRNAVLKIRISPMLLCSTTYPLPAHNPWSAGSRSPRVFVGSDALSTASSPFTPTAPPADLLIESQPAPCESQLTDGGVGSGPLRGRVGDGNT